MAYYEEQLKKVLSNRNYYINRSNLRAWGKQKKQYYCGVYPLEFLYVNEWSDPFIHCYGVTFDCYDLEETLLSDYREEHPEDKDDENFDNWVSQNKAYAREVAREITDNIKANTREDVKGYYLEKFGKAATDYQIEYTLKRTIG